MIISFREDSPPKKQKIALVGILRKKGPRSKIVYNTGLIIPSTSQEEKRLEDFLKSQELEVIEVNLVCPTPPSESSSIRGYYCPYCKHWEYWKTTLLGKVCPICGISTNDYYVKNYNHLWGRFKITNQELKLLDKRNQRNLPKKRRKT